MPLDPRFRAALYAAFAALFITGVAWLVIDGLRDTPGAWGETSAMLLMVHGGVAMALLLLLGALFVQHVLPAWRQSRNRGSGTVMLALNALLILTAFGLYYLGSERWRTWTSDLHIGLGLALPALLLFHVVLGKRESARRRQSLSAVADGDCAGGRLARRAGAAPATCAKSMPALAGRVSSAATVKEDGDDADREVGNGALP